MYWQSSRNPKYIFISTQWRKSELYFLNQQHKNIRGDNKLGRRVFALFLSETMPKVANRSRFVFPLHWPRFTSSCLRPRKKWSSPCPISAPARNWSCWPKKQNASLEVFCRKKYSYWFSDNGSIWSSTFISSRCDTFDVIESLLMIHVVNSTLNYKSIMCSLLELCRYM